LKEENRRKTLTAKGQVLELQYQNTQRGSECGIFKEITTVDGRRK
jgi:hypothetical protein